MLGHLGAFAGLGQEPGDVQVGLPPGLLMDFAFHIGEAGRIGGQTFEPLGLTFGQHPPRLVGDLGWLGSLSFEGGIFWPTWIWY